MRTTFLALSLIVAGAAAAHAQTLSPADYAEINQLYARYNHAVDAADAKMIATVFTADGLFVSGARTMEGRKLVTAATPKERPQARHMATSVIINPSPEGARGSSYVMLVNLQATPPVVAGGGVYEDVIVKTKEGWRFQKRTFFSQSTPATPPAQSSTR